MAAQLNSAVLQKKSRTALRAGVPAPRRSAKPEHRPPDEAGFVLMDSDERVIYANPPAQRILTYPHASENASSDRAAIFKRLESIYPLKEISDSSTGAAEFESGNRKYTCRAFYLTKMNGAQNSGNTVAFIIERKGTPPHALTRVCSHFHLTQRERQVVEFSIQGLTNKEIAARMNISPNTVRAFIRMIMVKLGVSTRSGIAGVVFRAIYSGPTVS